MRHLHGEVGLRAMRAAPSRRTVLGTLAALGAGGVLPRLALGEPADALDPTPRRIDVHHHFFPPAWLEHAAKQQPGPAPMMREWTPARVLEHMDKSGVATAIASLSPWGVAFAGVAELPQLARVCNDSAAQMIRDHPGRFGLFAAMRCRTSMRA